jgi:O-acetyl-ADP-ribose deacetylase (regulator of RNase III)
VLANCYRRSLEVLVDNGLHSIAFPCIATGVYGYDNEKAANVALDTVRGFLEKDPRSKNVSSMFTCYEILKQRHCYRLIKSYLYCLMRRTRRFTKVLMIFSYATMPLLKALPRTCPQIL